MKRIAAITLVFVLVSVVACKRSPRLDFTFDRCGAGVEPYGRPYEGIERIEWVSETTLRVEGFVRAPGGGVSIRGEYNLDGDNLILRYEVRRGRTVTTSGCAHAVVYELVGMERREYTISIVPVEAENE